MQSQHQQNLLQKSHQFVCNSLGRIKHYLSQVTATNFPTLSQKLLPLKPYLGKAQQLYQNHKEIILIVTAATVTYALVKLTKKKQTKIKKAKGTTKQQLIEKSFMSDNEQASCIQDTTTSKMTPVHSQKQKKYKKQKGNTKILLERIESSSSEEEEVEDKIFFEVYKTYQVA